MNTRGPGKRGPGRPKGSPNKVTAAARDVIANTAENLGGEKRLLAWVKKDELNERAFWSVIYPKLLPLQLSGPDGKDGLPGEILIRVIDPNR